MPTFSLTTGEVVVVEGTKWEWAKGIVKAARDVIDNRDVWACALACAEVESRFRMYANRVWPESLSYPHEAVGSDHSSVGLFQQRPDYGWGSVRDCMDVTQSTRSFLGGPNGPRGGGSPRGLLDRPDWQGKIKRDPGDLVDDVQISAFPDRYRWRFPGIYTLIDAALPEIGAGGTGTGAGGGEPKPVLWLYEDGNIPALRKADGSDTVYGLYTGMGVWFRDMGLVDWDGVFLPVKGKNGGKIVQGERSGSMWAFMLKIGGEPENTAPGAGGGGGDLGRVIHPLPGAYDYSDPFGGYAGGRRRPHTGSDYNRGIGAGHPLPALSGGEVVHAGYTDWNGHCVTVRMANGDGYYAYLHMLGPAHVSRGQTVTPGQILGQLGNSGYNSLGAHLHITMSDSPQAHDGIGNLFDPQAYLVAKSGQA